MEPTVIVAVVLSSRTVGIDVVICRHCIIASFVDRGSVFRYIGRSQLASLSRTERLNVARLVARGVKAEKNRL